MQAPRRPLLTPSIIFFSLPSPVARSEKNEWELKTFYSSSPLSLFLSPPHTLCRSEAAPFLLFGAFTAAAEAPRQSRVHQPPCWREEEPSERSLLLLLLLLFRCLCRRCIPIAVASSPAAPPPPRPRRPRRRRTPPLPCPAASSTRRTKGPAGRPRWRRAVRVFGIAVFFF